MRVKFVIPVLASILVLGGIGFSQDAFAITETSKLTASDGAANDQFGVTVSISGDRAIVGARGNSDAGTNSGSAYIFERDALGNWNEITKLTASDAVGGAFFGASVSISGDIVVVGAQSDSDIGPGAGSAYIFERDAQGDWNEVAKLFASDAASGDRFGVSVDIDDTIVIVGADLNSDSGSGTGSAYIFERDALGDWNEESKLLSSDAASEDRFGHSVSVSGDRVIVGAQGDDLPCCSASGTAYIFERDAQGDWNEEAKLLASDGGQPDNFGFSVSLSGDRAVIGAFHNSDAGPSSGSAYIFELDALGDWNEVTKLLASDAAAGDFFGRSVSISNDKVVVGAHGDFDSGANTGSAYLFERDALGDWNEEAKLLASDAAAGAFFGFPVSIFGNTVFSGALGNTDNGFNSGAVYVYELVPTFDSLREQILSLDLPDGLTNALISKVDAAEQQFEAGNNDTAANILNAFINQAEAQTGKKVDPIDAADLTATANNLIAQIQS